MEWNAMEWNGVECDVIQWNAMQRSATHYNIRWTTTQRAAKLGELRAVVRMQTACIVDAARAGSFRRDAPTFALDEVLQR